MTVSFRKPGSIWECNLSPHSEVIPNLAANNPSHTNSCLNWPPAETANMKNGHKVSVSLEKVGLHFPPNS